MSICGRIGLGGNIELNILCVFCCSDNVWTFCCLNDWKFVFCTGLLVLIRNLKEFLCSYNDLFS